jgi:hypothetical protein
MDHLIQRNLQQKETLEKAEKVETTDKVETTGMVAMSLPQPQPEMLPKMELPKLKVLLPEMLPKMELPKSKLESSHELKLPLSFCGDIFCGLNFCILRVGLSDF